MIKLEKLVPIVIFLILTSTVIPISAQQFSIGELADQTLEVTLEENGNAHVIHHVSNSADVKQIPIVSKSFSNLVIVDKKGNEPQHALLTGESISVTVFPTLEDYTIEYDLEKLVTLVDGVWTLDFVYLATTTFFFPEDVDLFFANHKPVKFDNANGMRCHGCEILLEYIFDEPIYSKEIKWEDKEFKVGFRSLTEITSFNLDQPHRSLSFEVNEEKKIITLFIPLELLWNPYEVYLNEEKILKHEFFNNGTHIWLNIRPQTTGQITIIGTSVVPEFPILIPLFVGMAAVIILQQRIKINHR